MFLSTNPIRLVKNFIIAIYVLYRDNFVSVFFLYNEKIFLKYSLDIAINDFTSLYSLFTSLLLSKILVLNNKINHI